MTKIFRNTNRAGTIGAPLNGTAIADGSGSVLADQFSAIAAAPLGMPHNFNLNDAAGVLAEDDNRVAPSTDPTKGIKQIKISSDRTFQLVALVLGSSCAGDFDILDAKVQNTPLFPSSKSVINGDSLSEVAVQNPARFFEAGITIDSNNPLYLTVRNKSAEIREFSATIWGNQGIPAQ